MSVRPQGVAEAGEAGAEPAPQDGPKPEMAERERISRLLIVEDEPAQLHTLTSLMKNEGFQVISCPTAAEALKHIKHQNFGVAVIDLRLPDLSGTELLEKLREIDRQVQVIIHTGYGSFDSAKTAVNLRAFAYVEKLGNPAELIRHVHRAFRDRFDRYAEDLEDAVAARTADLRESLAEQQRLQEQLHQSQKMEAVGLLAAGVAHDFNNLLTVISAHANLARRKISGDSAALESLTAVEEAVQQATGVTRSLLTFSHELPTQKVPTNLCAVVEEGTRMLRRTLPAAVELVVETDCEPMPWVNADKVQLQQVLLNLAVNARDAMPDGGILRISVEPGTGQDGGPEPQSTIPGASFASIVVADSGMGMTPAVQSRIFEPFFTTKARGRGTGLGLSVVHGIVQAHEGCIDVRSDVGMGATFTITLPCVNPESVLMEPQLSTPVSRGHGELILLAEDNRTVLRLMTSALRALGYEAVQATDGQEMLQRYREQQDRIRAMVVDIDLPKRSGLDCLREIRLSGDRTPAVVITGDIESNYEAQIDPDSTLLRKPFQMSELGKSVAEALERTRNEQARQ